jgi:hypothetical protein
LQKGVMLRVCAKRVVLAALMMAGAATASAHDGPPYPIVSDHAVGAYLISVWTDPDTTDDGSSGGQFWVTVDPRNESVALPADTRAQVSIAPLDREGPAQSGWSEPVRGDVSRQFVALVMDHEGRFNVRVAIDGPLGPAKVAAEVEATYDLRPPPILLALYVVPFLLVGFLWLKLLLRRRRAEAPAVAATSEAEEQPGAGVGPRDH